MMLRRKKKESNRENEEFGERKRLKKRRQVKVFAFGIETIVIEIGNRHLIKKKNIWQNAFQLSLIILQTFGICFV